MLNSLRSPEDLSRGDGRRLRVHLGNLRTTGCGAARGDRTWLSSGYLFGLRLLKFRYSL